MGTANWHAANPARNRGLGAANVFGELITSGATTTSTTASDLDDGAAGAGSDVSFPVGAILRIEADEAMRIQTGGGTATASSGYYVGAGANIDIEITAPGTVSVIDVA